VTIIKNLSIIQVVVLLTFSGCGTETGNPGDGPKSGSALQARIALDVNAQMEELSESTDDPTDNAEQTSLGLLQAKDPNTTRDRSCTESNGQATVVADIASAKAKEFTNGTGASIELNVTRRVSRTIVHSRRDGVAIQCAAGGQYARLRAADFANLDSKTTVEAFSRRDLSRKQSTGESTLFKSMESTRTGSRSVSFSLEKESTGLIRAIRTTSSDFTQTLVRKVGSKSVSQSSRLTVDSSNPLVIAVERPSAAEGWTTRTIKSGLIKSIAPDGSRVETTIQNLVQSIASPCQPLSGTISGSYFAKADSTVADSTYTVTFSSGSATLTIQGLKDDAGKASDSSEELAVSFCEAN
jgi:hypothetical protein